MIGAYGLRDVLAVVLVSGVGVGLLARPAVVLRLLVLTHAPDTGRRGPYGGEPEYSARSLWAARAVGVLSLGLGALVLAQPQL